MEGNRGFMESGSTRSVLSDLIGNTAVIDLAFDSIVVLDMEDKVLFWNERAVRQYGWTKEAAFGHVFHDLLHTEFPIPFDAVKSALFQHGRWEGELTHTACGGARLAVLTRWVIQRNDRGDALGIVVVEKDITDRQEAEDKHERLTVAIEQAAEGFFVLNIEGNFEYVNKAYCSMSGYSREELLAGNMRMLRSPSIDESYYESVWTCIRSGNVWLGRLTRRRKDGATAYTQAAIAPIRDKYGRVASYAGVSMDITEQIALEEQLQQARKMEAIGTLAGGIAHDFNNILAAIMGNAELAMDDLPADSSVHHNLKQILTAGIRGRDLVRQILTFTRKTDVQRKPISLTPIIKDTYALLRATIPATIDMVLSCEATSDWVEADHIQIQQVVMNLITNAADAMRETGGTIRTLLADGSFSSGKRSPGAGSADCEYVTITVSDTGCGMTEEVKSRIFEPFFTTKKSAGVGMGLAVVYGVVKNCNGTITVSSRPGKGSVFTVYLQKVARAEGEESASLSILKGGKERVLLVDDEDAVLTMAQTILLRLGYQVTTAVDGVQAIDLFRADPQAFDLVITDQTMPRMTGTTLAGELRKMRNDIPVILCSGHRHSALSKHMAAQGIRACVNKPFRRSELAKAVRIVLGKGN